MTGPFNSSQSSKRKVQLGVLCMQSEGVEFLWSNLKDKENIIIFHVTQANSTADGKAERNCKSQSCILSKATMWSALRESSGDWSKAFKWKN